MTVPSASTVLGVRVHHVTMAGAVAYVESLLGSGPPGYVVTLNAGMLREAARNDAFRRIVNAAALVTPDGMGTLLAGRILGVRFPERVAGVDLTPRLCAMCARRGFRVYLLGAAPGVAVEAAAALIKRHPGLQVAGTRHGYFTPLETPGVIRDIRDSRAKLLLVALGSPKQERWLSEHLQATGANVGMGVGGTFDVYAGRAPLAPAWTRRIGMEWLYRLLREPRRWRVAATLPGVLLRAVKERLTGMRKSPGSPDSN